MRTALADAMFAGDFDDRTEVVVDWAGVPAPPLVGDIAEHGDYVKLGDGPLDDLADLDDLDEDELEDELIDRGYVEYGDHDFEA